MAAQIPSCSMMDGVGGSGCYCVVCKGLSGVKLYMNGCEHNTHIEIHTKVGIKSYSEQPFQRSKSVLIKMYLHAPVDIFLPRDAGHDVRKVLVQTPKTRL